MSHADPISIENVDINKLELRIPTKESKSSNGSMYYVYHNKVKLRIVMPKMSAPFGAGTQKENPNKYSMAISFEGMNDETPLGRKLRRAHSKMQQIDERVQDLMMENKETFFKDVKEAATKKDPKKKGQQGISDELVRARYNSFLKSKDDMPELMYLALQTARVQEKDAAKYTEEQKAILMKRFAGMPKYDFLVDADGNAIDVNVDNVTDIIPWGSRVKPVIELAYLWVTKDKCFPIWTFVHGLLVSDAKERSFDIRREDDEDDDVPRDEDDNGNRMEEDENRQEDPEDAMDEDGGAADEEEEEEEEQEMTK